MQFENPNRASSTKEVSNDAKKQIDKVIRQLNGSEHNNSGRRTSPIRSINTSVLGKSEKPVNTK